MESFIIILGSLQSYTITYTLDVLLKQIYQTHLLIITIHEALNFIMANKSNFEAFISDSVPSFKCNIILFCVFWTLWSAGRQLHTLPTYDVKKVHFIVPLSRCSDNFIFYILHINIVVFSNVRFVIKKINKKAHNVCLFPLIA